MDQCGDQFTGVKAIEYPKGNWKKPKHSVETPLFIALKKGDLALAKLLLDHDADPNTPDLYGSPPLVWAVEMEKKEMVELLFQYDARVNVNVVDGQGMTPLVYAVKNHLNNFSKDDFFVKLLLEKGANPNYRG